MTRVVSFISPCTSKRVLFEWDVSAASAVPFRPKLPSKSDSSWGISTSSALLPETWKGLWKVIFSLKGILYPKKHERYIYKIFISILSTSVELTPTKENGTWKSNKGSLQLLLVKPLKDGISKRSKCRSCGSCCSTLRRPRSVNPRQPRKLKWRSCGRHWAARSCGPHCGLHLQMLKMRMEKKNVEHNINVLAYN